MTWKTSALSFVALVALAAAALASPTRGGPGRPPPQEALEACSGRAEGDTCTFEGRHGTVSGTCQLPREGDALVCHPADHPKRRGREQ